MPSIGNNSSMLHKTSFPFYVGPFSSIFIGHTIQVAPNRLLIPKILTHQLRSKFCGRWRSMLSIKQHWNFVFVRRVRRCQPMMALSMVCGLMLPIQTHLFLHCIVVSCGKIYQRIESLSATGKSIGACIAVAHVGTYIDVLGHCQPRVNTLPHILLSFMRAHTSTHCRCCSCGHIGALGHCQP